MMSLYQVVWLSRERLNLCVKKKELIDRQMGVRHSFTVWGAKGDSSQYDAAADLASWEALMDFLRKQL